MAMEAAAIELRPASANSSPDHAAMRVLSEVTESEVEFEYYCVDDWRSAASPKRCRDRRNRNEPHVGMRLIAKSVWRDGAHAPPSNFHTGMPSFLALSARLAEMPEPGKTMTPIGRTASIWSLRRNGTALPWRMLAAVGWALSGRWGGWLAGGRGPSRRAGRCSVYAA